MNPPPPQAYELKKDEIDGALDKARAQATALNDKYLSKVGVGAGGQQCAGGDLGAYWLLFFFWGLAGASPPWHAGGLSWRTPAGALVLPLPALPAPPPPALAHHTPPCPPHPAPSKQVMAKIPRHTPAKPAESSSVRKEE